MSTTPHLAGDELRLFLRGELAADRTRDRLAHLLRGCEACAGEVRRELDRKQVRSEETYSRAMLETVAFVLDREAPLGLERIAAPGLMVRLLDLAWEQRRLLVRNDPRYRTWGLCERLLSASRDAIWEVHQDQILDRARTGVLIAEHLDPRRYGEDHVQDLLAEARAALANAHRIRAEFRQARQELDRARHHRALGTGDDLDAVRLASLEASLLVSRGFFEEAVELLRGEEGRLARYDEGQLEARLRVQRGMALMHFDPPAAVAAYEEALERLDPARSPRLDLCARLGLAWSLNEAGRCHEALMQLQRSRRLFRQFPDRWAQLQVGWTEARVAFRLGNLDEAEASYQAVWTDAFELDLRLETAMISLDLIEVQLALERDAEATRVASRLVDLFTAWKVHTPAVEAWTFLLEALRRRSASGVLVAEVAAYLRRAWRNPEIRFPR